VTTIGAFIKRHAVLTYYVLTFAISWSGVLLVIGGPGAIPGAEEELNRLLPVAIVAMVVGPSVAGVLLTGLVCGRAGFRDLRSRLLKWRVGVRWYAIALLTAPLASLAVLLALSLTSPVYLPGVFASNGGGASLVFGLAASLVAGIFEELGWTGFALPQLRLRYSVLATGLIMGVLWGAWHLLTNNFWAGGASAGTMPLPLFVAVNGFTFLVGQLVAFRVLMVWVYERTGSLLVAILMHTTLTASALILGPVAISGAAQLIYGFVLAVAMWAIVAGVVAANHGQLSRQPLPRRAP
jgi:membrane protease YdiL (CAAX protease family)